MSIADSLEDVSDEQLSEVRADLVMIKTLQFILLQLERLLDEAEQRYTDAQLDQLQVQEDARRVESDRAHLKREVDSLNEQLKNLRSIYQSWPTTCFNKVNIESQ